MKSEVRVEIEGLLVAEQEQDQNLIEIYIFREQEIQDSHTKVRNMNVCVWLKKRGREMANSNSGIDKESLYTTTGDWLASYNYV